MYAKVVLSLVLLAVVASAIELSDKAKEIFKECRKENPLPPDHIQDALENHKLPKKQEGKCFLECVLVKGGVLKDGVFNVERAQELALQKVKEDQKKQAKEIIAACKNTEKVSGKCEYAVKLTKCVYDGLEKAKISDDAILAERKA